jgi:hypothetical protein
VAAVVAQMRGDAVGAGLDRDQRRAHRIGTLARPRIAQGGDVIDIYAEAERRSFGHANRPGWCHARARPAHPSIFAKSL